MNEYAVILQLPNSWARDAIDIEYRLFYRIASIISISFKNR